METLWNLYSQRLSQLNSQFLHLLNQFQTSHLFTTPQLAKYRLQYLASILEKTLHNHQEQLIFKLYHQIHQLQTHNQSLQTQIHQLTSQLQTPPTIDHFEFKDNSLGSTKVSTRAYHTDKDDTDSFIETSSSKFVKTSESKPSLLTGNKRKQREIKLAPQPKGLTDTKHTKRPQNLLNSSSDQEEQQEIQKMRISFKYLKL